MMTMRAMMMRMAMKSRKDEKERESTLLCFLKSETRSDSARGSSITSSFDTGEGSSETI